MRPSTPSVAREDSYFVFGSTTTKEGNTNVLAKRNAEIDETIKHERNLEEWRERHERLEDKAARRRVTQARNTRRALQMLSQTVCGTYDRAS